jgi:hypothetical protein
MLQANNQGLGASSEDTFNQRYTQFVAEPICWSATAEIKSLPLTLEYTVSLGMVARMYMFNQ